MAQRLFRLENVSNQRLENIDLTINEQDKIVIFGPSGAGKSSLLFVLNRLQAHISGVIKYKNRPIESWDVGSLRKEVGLVLQEANLFPGTVRDNLRFGPDLFGHWENEMAEKLMEFVQLPNEYLDKQADKLSGGEQQRVNLARTLANQPRVLLLDEPTSALDGKTAEEIEKLLLKLAEEEEKTMIMVTHNLAQAKRMGNKGFFMEDGRLIEAGSLNELLENPKTKALHTFLQKNG